jgi:hypothetical protein
MKLLLVQVKKAAVVVMAVENVCGGVVVDECFAGAGSKCCDGGCSDWGGGVVE